MEEKKTKLKQDLSTLWYIESTLEKEQCIFREDVSWQRAYWLELGWKKGWEYSHVQWGFHRARRDQPAALHVACITTCHDLASFFTERLCEPERWGDCHETSWNIMKHHGTSWNIMEHHEIWPLFTLWLLCHKCLCLWGACWPSKQRILRGDILRRPEVCTPKCWNRNPLQILWYVGQETHDGLISILGMNTWMWNHVKKKTPLRCSNVSWISLEPCLDQSSVFISLLIGPMIYHHCFCISFQSNQWFIVRLVVGMCDIPAIFTPIVDHLMYRNRILVALPWGYLATNWAGMEWEGLT